MGFRQAAFHTREKTKFELSSGLRTDETLFVQVVAERVFQVVDQSLDCHHWLVFYGRADDDSLTKSRQQGAE